MARNEKTLGLAKDVGTTPVAVYTVPSSTKTVITGMMICNTKASLIGVSVYVTRSGTDYYIMQDNQMFSKMTLEFSGHIVLDTVGDTLKVVSDSAASVDVVLSGWEKT